MRPEDALRIYALSRLDIGTLAAAGWCKAEGNLLRFAAQDRPAVADLLSAAKAIRILRDPTQVTTDDVQSVMDVEAILDNNRAISLP